MSGQPRHPAAAESGACTAVLVIGKPPGALVQPHSTGMTPTQNTQLSIRMAWGTGTLGRMRRKKERETVAELPGQGVE